MANPVRKLERTRRDARRFAAEARKLATGGRPRLDGKIRDAVMTACDAVDAAAAEGDATRLSAALRALDALWGEHLERLGKAPWRTYVEVVAAAVIAALLVRAGVVAGEPIASGAMVPTLLPGDRVLVSRLAYGVALPFTGRRLWGAPPRRGDVVALEGAGAPGVGRVARVVGIPGDVIAVRGEVLYVNGVPQPRAPDGEQPYGEAGDRLRRVCRRFREALARGPMIPGDGGDPGMLEARWQAAALSGVATHGVLQCRPAGLAPPFGPSQVVPPGQLFVMGDNRDRTLDPIGPGGPVPLDRVRGQVTRISFSWGEGGALGGPRLGRLFRRVE